jgi:hypothetical protein
LFRRLFGQLAAFFGTGSHACGQGRTLLDSDAKRWDDSRGRYYEAFKKETWVETSIYVLVRGIVYTEQDGYLKEEKRKRKTNFYGNLQTSER